MSINVLAVVIAASLWLLAAPSAMAQSSAHPSRLKWFVPPLLPPGALIAVVSGDPTVPGLSTLQLSMPDGYRFPPHYHPSFEHVEVREGTLLVGMGDRIDPKRTRPLAAGDFGHRTGGDAPFLHRQGADRAVGDVHGALHDYLPPGRGRSAATGFSLRLLRREFPLSCPGFFG
jgi:hypothetical protein